MQTITPFLWFNDEAHDAAKFYVSIFKNSKITKVRRAGKKVLGVNFRLSGRAFIAFNGGPGKPFTEAVSLFVDCEDQREVNRLWNRLSKGGKERRCGWLRDKYGLAWQIIPSILGDLLFCKDAAKSERAFQAMLKMTKINIKALQDA